MSNKYSDLFLEGNGLVDTNQQGRIMNIAHKGFEGILPAIGGVIDGTTYEAHLANALYVSQSVIPKVISTPRFMEYMPNPEAWRAIWVSIIEEHAKSITGFNSTMTAETDELEIGMTGEMQSAHKATKKARTVLNFEIPEKMHKAVSKFLGLCLIYGQGDYITGKPLASNFITSLDDIGGGWTPDMYSGSVMFIEPDPTRLEVVDAWLSVQFYFKGTGDRTAKKNLSAGGETVTLNIETAGITMSTDKVFEFARTLLPNIANIRALPDTDMSLPVDAVSADIAQ